MGKSINKEVVELSPIQRFIRVIVSPSKTFEFIKAKPDWIFHMPKHPLVIAKEIPKC